MTLLRHLLARAERNSATPDPTVGPSALLWSRRLNVQALLCGRQDFVAHVAVAFQSPVVHSREHSDVSST